MKEQPSHPPIKGALVFSSSGLGTAWDRVTWDSEMCSTHYKTSGIDIQRLAQT